MKYQLQFYFEGKWVLSIHETQNLSELELRRIAQERTEAGLHPYRVLEVRVIYQPKLRG